MIYKLLVTLLGLGTVFLAFNSLPNANAQSLGTSETIPVTNNNTSYEIVTSYSNGQVVNATLIPEDKQLLLDLEPSLSEDGQLVVTLPREMIDAKSADNSADGEFTVVFSDSEAVFEEANSTEMSRTLAIDIPVGTEYLTIIGTQVAPEFPVYVGLVSALAIVSIIGFGKLARQFR